MSTNSIEILIQNGFKCQFPFIDHFRKQISPTQMVQIKTFHSIQRNEVVEDGVTSIVFNVTKINLPQSETKFFHKFENALKFAND